MSDQVNPLQKYFRQPQIFAKLPSQGRWYEHGSLEMPATNELPVYAMTAKDEIMIKTPDALMNGQSTVELIQSCFPNIKNAWKVPSIDIDAILIAIRIATYGNRMDFVSVCPHCKTKTESALDLSVMLDSIKCPDFETTVNVGEFEIYLKPQTYYDINQQNLKTYEEQRILGVISDDNMGENEKLEKFNILFKSILNMTVNQVAKSVAAIKTSDGTTVENLGFIQEFFANCDRPVWTAVRDRIAVLVASSELKRIPVTCENEVCAKEYVTPLIFEHSTFFV